LPYAVPALASFGIEAWFGALAWGAAQVVLVPDPTTARASMRALSDELEVAHAILSALGETPARIVLAVGTAGVPAVPSGRMGPVAGVLAGEGKRETLYAAIDHLNRSRARSREAIRLPPRASLGAVTVDKDRCTLCFACVNLCPTQALTSVESPQPELRFTESRCVQCGLCECGCPERAVDLHPRMQLDHAAREASTTLCADELVPCLGCGAPFMGKRMLGRSIEMVRGQPLLLEHGIERLKHCPSCRAQATLRDGMPGRGSEDG
jgi:ferredoxin